MSWRKVVWVGVIGCLVVSLAGCGPRVSTASVGITVDAAGKPVLVLRDCEAHITLVRVVHWTPDRFSTADPVSVDYTVSAPAKGVVQFPLLTGGSGWKMTGEFRLTAGDYVVQLRSNDDRNGAGTEFSLADLQLLKPGLVKNHSATAGTTAGPTSRGKISTLEQFSTPACK